MLKENNDRLNELIRIRNKTYAENSEGLEKQKAVILEIEKYKNYKETLANSLEESYEKLVNERMTTAETFSQYMIEKDTNHKYSQKLSQEQSIYERLSEQICNEREALSKLNEEFQRNKDLDVILTQTLKELGIEGCITKTEKGYFHNNNHINLLLHNESFVVAKIEGRLIPLSDFLTTPYPSTSKKTFADRKTENRSMDSKDCEKSKSPIRVNQTIHFTKTQKTPLRDRNTAYLDKKRPFK